MKTIKIPKKLHYLTDRLPKANYEKKKQHEENIKYRSLVSKIK